MKFNVLICARGGSKGLKDKNIKLFAGKPLISWTILLAKKLKDVEGVYVSTDSQKIANISKKYGANVPFLRPIELADDHISAVEVLKHAVLTLKFDGIVILLQPTSPLKSIEDVFTGINLIKDKKNAVISVKKYIHNSNLTTFSKPGEKFIPLSKSNKDIYVPNGAVYIADSDWLMNNSSFYSEEVSTFEMPLNRSEDIDYEYQFKTAENFFKEDNSDKQKY